MRAKVHPDYHLSVVTCLNQREFVKYEWRTVPPGREAELDRLVNDYEMLILEEETAVVETPEPTAEPEPPAKKPPAKKVASRKRKK